MESDRNVTLYWVPTYVNIPGNEKADRHVRKVTLKAAISQLLQPRSDRKCYIKQEARNFWEKKGQHGNLTNKLREITDSTSLLCSSSYSYREWPRKLVKVRIWHCLLTHGHVLAGGRTSGCRNCNVELTIKHIMIKCLNFETKRRLRLCNYRLL